MQISVDTKDVFIEVTGTDEVKTHTVLNMVCTMFSEYCSTPYQIEPVEVVDAFGNSQRESLMADCHEMHIGAACKVAPL